MSRLKLFGLWLICAIFTPVLMIAMLIQAIIGSEARAHKMAIALDGCGNSLFGGPPDQTISARTGNALLEGRHWAQVAAPIIDMIFWNGHCAASATDIRNTNG